MTRTGLLSSIGAVTAGISEARMSSIPAGYHALRQGYLRTAGSTRDFRDAGSHVTMAKVSHLK